MANAVSRAAPHVYVPVFADPVSHPTAAWILDADLTAVTISFGVLWATKYWTVSGDSVLLLDQAGRDAVDAAEAAARVTANRATSEAAVDETGEPVGWELRALIEVFNRRDNFLVNRIAEIQAALDTVRDTPGNAGARLDTLPANWLATDTRTKPDAIADYKTEISSGGADS